VGVKWSGGFSEESENGFAVLQGEEILPLAVRSLRLSFRTMRWFTSVDESDQ
jgi:hypothetical protein